MDEPAIHQDSKPLVSVIVPIYNISSYVDRCVESILAQTYRELEVLLIDDGSTDESGTICDAWSQRDRRIRVIHKSNGGLSSARNAGIDAALGEYILFVDGDDYIDPPMISSLLCRAQETNSDMVITGFSWVDELGVIIKSEQYPSSIMTPREFWRAMYPYSSFPKGVQIGFFVVAWNKLYKRSVFSVERYDEGKLHEDEFILHRVVSNCSRIAVLEGHFYNYVQRSGSITHHEQPSSLLDAADAMMNRSDYFLKQDMEYESLACCVDVATTMSRIPLSFSDQWLSARTKAIRDVLLARIKTQNINCLNQKSRIKLFLYCNFPALYRALVLIKRLSS